MANSTLREIESRYGIKYATLHARLKSRKIPHKRVGNVIVVSHLRVDAIIACPDEDAKYRDHPLYKRWKRNRHRMCEAWKSSFEAFAADFENVKIPRGMKLMPVNSSLGLSPNNWRWA